MVKGKMGLGKGIESLIQDHSLDMPDEMSKSGEQQPDTYLSLAQIEPNRSQPRKVFDENALEELADSIKKYGIIQPLVVRKKENFYEIVAGERRWRAAKLAGLKEIPVVIKEYTDDQMMEISLIENIQRENLNPIEEAMAYQVLIQEFHLKQEEIASRISKSRTFITNTIRLLKLEERVQNMISEGMISGGHGRALLPIQDGEQQYQTALKIYDEGLSVRDTEQLVKRILAANERKEKEKEKITEKSQDTYMVAYEDAENKLKNIMGTKVNIKNKNNKGRIEIEYYSLEELERLMELFERINS